MCRKIPECFTITQWTFYLHTVFDDYTVIRSTYSIAQSSSQASIRMPMYQYLCFFSSRVGHSKLWGWLDITVLLTNCVQENDCVTYICNIFKWKQTYTCDCGFHWFNRKFTFPFCSLACNTPIVYHLWFGLAGRRVLVLPVDFYFVFSFFASLKTCLAA